MVVVGTINVYRREGWRVVHVDASARGIWDSEAGRSVPVDVVADMRALPFEDASVDRVQAWHSLEHVNMRGGQDALVEWARVLRPGGILSVKVPDMMIAARELVEAPHSIRGEGDWLVTAEWDFCRRAHGDQSAMADAHLNAHLWSYTPRSLAALLVAAGFTPGENRGPGPDGDEIHYEAVKTT